MEKAGKDGNGNENDEKLLVEKLQMDAENVEKLLKILPNFGGIFDAKQLKNVKLLSYPVSIVIHDKGHWIAVYITKKSIELMDSLGWVRNSACHREILNLIHIQAKYKKKLMWLCSI